MKISVLIPAYNASATIRATLDAALEQTLPPAEILVLDDGSTDETHDILQTYGSRITPFRQSNRGAAQARNFLCKQARGEVLAFLDSDDIWHPHYLDVQQQMRRECPSAIAWFTDHENFFGSGKPEWQPGLTSRPIQPELLAPETFIRRYDETPLSFQMSCFCVRKAELARLGVEPFRVSGAEDTFLHNWLPLLGPVGRTSAPLVGYRIHESSLSSNRLRVSLLVVDAFLLLEPFYRATTDPVLYRTFKKVFASRRRNCGKYLMGAGRISEARNQFLRASGTAPNPASMAKSLGLYASTLLPGSMQPRWPAGQRVANQRISETNIAGS
jgi:glycosyltransferase involved in cell wall biosynthesis